MPAEREAERWLVVGLGNPGAEYRHNRHNVGFMVVDRLCAGQASLGWRGSTRFKAELAVGELSRRPVVLLKPQTYMNLSGRAVGPVAQFYRIPPARVVVVHDEVDLALGRLKVKQGGGDAGHNGLRSLTELLGDPGYIRVRFGVDRPTHGEVADYVLSNFRAEEAELVDQEIDRAAKAVRTVMTRGLREAMNRFNRVPRKPTTEEPAAGAPADSAPGGDVGGGRD